MHYICLLYIFYIIVLPTDFRFRPSKYLENTLAIKLSERAIAKYTTAKIGIAYPVTIELQDSM